MKSSGMLLVLSLCFLSCKDLGDSNVGVETGLVRQVMDSGILYTLTLSASTFIVGDTLKGNFEVLNVSQLSRTFSFANVQQFGFELNDAGGARVLYEPRIIQPMGSEFILKPNEKKQFPLRSSFRDGNGQLLATGEHTLYVYLLCESSPRLSLNIRLE